MAKQEDTKTLRGKLDINEKYLDQFDEVRIRIPKGYKKTIQALAAKNGKSVNTYIIDLLNEKLQDTSLKIPSGIKAHKKNQEKTSL